MNVTIFEELKDVMENKIEDAHETYGCELYDFFFNQDYFVESEVEGEECMKRWNVTEFELIGYNIVTEQQDFGEVYWLKEDNPETHLNAMRQVNLAVYWLGREMMYSLNDALDSCWDDEMNLWDIKRVQEAIKNLKYGDVL